VSRRRATVELAAVLAAVGHTEPAEDDLVQRTLDAAEEVLRELGLRPWSVEDVAARADVGRTSVYRRFGGRDDLVHAVLARELRRTLQAMSRAAGSADSLEDKAVAVVMAALEALDGSVVDHLLRSDPATFLPFLTTDAGPLLAIAREAIAAQAAALDPSGRPPPPALAEAAARVGLSFVLTRDTALPVHDPAELAAAVRAMVRPFLTPVAG
jgi:AcrR family transcriptional regulator